MRENRVFLQTFTKFSWLKLRITEFVFYIIAVYRLFLILIYVCSVIAYCEITNVHLTELYHLIVFLPKKKVSTETTDVSKLRKDSEMKNNLKHLLRLETSFKNV